MDNILAQQLIDRLLFLENEVKFLRGIHEFTLGRGTKSIKMGREGLWVGANTFAEVTTDPPAGTGIAIDGTFYGKNGASGSFASGDATPKTITVYRGLITSII